MNSRHIRALCDEHGIGEDEIPRKTRVDKMRLAEEILRQRVAKLEHGRWAIGEALKEVAANALGCADYDIEYEPGCHECESETNPIGECVYDGFDDPCWDVCLFCSQPYERK